MVPRQSRSPSAWTEPAIARPIEVATDRIVTPAQATKACRSMSPEHASVPSPPVSGWRPAFTSARPVCTEQEMPWSSDPSASSVICAAPGSSLYRSLIGRCKLHSSSRVTEAATGSGYLAALDTDRLPIDVVAVADQDVADHLGREEAMVDDTWSGGKAGSQLGRVADIAEVIGDHAALDKPAVRCDLVGAVDRDVEPVERLELLDSEAQVARGTVGGRRGRDAADAQFALG